MVAQPDVPKPKPVHDYPLDIFPCRVSGIDGVRAKAADSASGAVGGWDRENRIAYLPRTEDAYHRTVRMHESLHAIYSPKLTPEYAGMAGQAVEDSIMHLVHARTTGSTRRDELTTAFKDLRSIPKMSGGGKSSDTALLILLRAMSIIDAQPLTDKRDSRAAEKLLLRTLGSDAMMTARKKADEIGQELETGLLEIMECTRSEDRAGALARFKRYMVYEEETAPEDGGFTLVVGEAEDSSSAADDWEKIISITPSEKIEPKSQKASTINCDLLSDKQREELQSTLDTWPRMTVRKLFHMLQKKTKEGRDVKFAVSGIRIKSSRLMAAAVNPTGMTRVFEKRLHQRGGAVLIDASGSMHFTDDDLRKVIKVLPLGTIAYYSGTDDDLNPDGDLVIYSDKGLMYNGGDLPFHDGGNSIDLPAIQWLLSQPAPRWYIGDLGFCGCGKVFSEAARELIENAKSGNLVKHYHDVPSLMKSLGIPWAGKR